MTTPADAYKYFKGEPIKHPLGYDIEIDTPPDRAGVTDHSEYAGIVQLAQDPKSPVSKIPQAQPLILKAKTKEEILFVSFGVYAKPNATVHVALFVCALSVAAAVFLILEMDRPFEGVIRISDAPLREVLGRLGH